MNDFLLIIGAILLWLGGWLMGLTSAHRAEEARRKQEEEFAKELAALHVEPPPPLTEEEKRLIEHALAVQASAYEAIDSGTHLSKSRTKL